MRYVSYVRDMTDGGHESAAQQRNIERWMSANRGAGIGRKYTDSYGSADAFRRMLGDGADRRFDCVALDSLSSCGENVTQARYALLKVFFPSGIHFLCVQDGFSSEGKSEQEVDAYFGRKTSEARSSGLARGRLKRYGLPMTGRDVRYGYKLSADGRSLIPDEITAPVVREIYRLSAEGRNCAEIARQMNEEGHTVPLKYKMDAVGCVKEQEYSWKYRAVRQILLNPIYTGQGVRKVHGVDVPLDTEPLVSREAYEDAKSRLVPRDGAHKDRKKPAFTDNAFSGLIFDAGTGKRLSCTVIPETGQKVFIPWKGYGYLSKEDRVHNIPYGEVECQVLERLRAERCLAERVVGRMADCGTELEKALATLRERAVWIFNETERLVREGNAPVDDAFVGIMEEERRIRTAFSPQNPWVKTFCVLEAGEHLTSKFLKGTVAAVRVADLQDVEITPAQNEWKRMLPREWMEG